LRGAQHLGAHFLAAARESTSARRSASISHFPVMPPSSFTRRFQDARLG
jgi:hypothetical protein